MGFIIYDEKGVALSLAELDQQAAAFWNKPFSLSEYANPTPVFSNSNNLEGEELRKARFRSIYSRCLNWYDIIGYAISEQELRHEGWVNVVSTMISHRIGDHFIDTSDSKGPVNVKYPNVIRETETEIELNLNEDVIMKIQATMTYYKPYIELINHWASKGYTQFSRD